MSNPRTDDISNPSGKDKPDAHPTQDVGTPDPAQPGANPQNVPDPEDEAPPLYGEG